MDDEVTFFIKRQAALFEKKLLLKSLWQEIADNFYPERADFTFVRVLGHEFASNLITSYPILCRRDLGDSISTMLRPSNKQWFHMGTTRDDREDNLAKRWLQQQTTTMRRAMYDRHTGFSRATSIADHDFAAFGQFAMTIEVNWKRAALLYRTWHLRDMAWSEDNEGNIGEVYRKWKPYAIVLQQEMKGNIHPRVKEIVEKDPYQEIDCMHLVIPTELHGKYKDFKTPYVSVYIDIQNKYIMEETGITNPMYIIPRWVKVGTTQYAFSPAVTAALPDARLIQAMTLVLLEAGEKAVTPPMIAYGDALRSDIALYAGGITYADVAYDERMGEILRPILNDKAGIPFGVEMRNDIKEMISQAFYLNKLTLPPVTGEVTAYEIGQRIQEYIRQALPLFGPMETEYNGALCDITFDLLRRVGAFGRPEEMPQSLQAADFQFRFESPLHDAIEMEKVQQFQQASSIVSSAIPLYPMAGQMLDIKTALRDALDGGGIPAKWVIPEDQFAQIEQQAQDQQAQQQELQKIAQGSSVAESLGRAGESFANINSQVGQTEGQNGAQAVLP